MALAKISSKGQIVIPHEIREHRGLKEGMAVDVVDTSGGILLVQIPKKPLLALQGAAKGMGISWKDVKKMRQEDEAHDREKYSD